MSCMSCTQLGFKEIAFPGQVLTCGKNCQKPGDFSQILRTLPKNWQQRFVVTERAGVIVLCDKGLWTTNPRASRVVLEFLANMTPQSGGLLSYSHPCSEPNCFQINPRAGKSVPNPVFSNFYNAHLSM